MSHYATPFKINVDVSNRAVLGRIRAGRAYILLEQDCPCSPPLDVMTNATDDPADDQQYGDRSHQNTLEPLYSAVRFASAPDEAHPLK